MGDYMFMLESHLSAEQFRVIGLMRQLAGESGINLFLTGGAMRDMLGGFPVRDLDFTIEGNPQKFAKIAEKKFGAKIVGGDELRKSVELQFEGGIIAELGMAHQERFPKSGAKPQVSAATIYEDLRCRDFTVNALAIALDEPVLVDPCGGVADLAARRLRTPRSPEESFGDDPLRMLRAARFTATLGFAPDAELVEAMGAMRERLDIVSAERIRDELSKLLLAEDPSPGLWLVARTGLADHFLPELNSMRLEQDPIHRHKDVLAHTIAVVANTSPTVRLRLSALIDRKSTRLNSSHIPLSRMPSSA